ncbi:hypothetical protein FNW25_08915 [Flavobacterium franklandianum]|uniref:hypothetical protein n=1 Tax=Flavobacterium franklandianum TaxID=2594430 RepID=UPI0011799246|nr:hypothetical protein [Flavobacterium franklandianum]TRX25544.1 hypothetical protein FNW25_08915 [Flavobacterium franklandianum]
MTPETLEIIQGLVSGYFVELTTPVLKNWLTSAFTSQPELAEKFKNAKTSQEFEAATEELTSVIEALAGEGKIEVDQATIEAIKGITFDHQQGTVTIMGSTLKAQNISLGGTGSGITTLTNTISQTPGTRIELKGGAQIIMTGNARIDQKG